MSSEERANKILSESVNEEWVLVIKSKTLKDPRTNRCKCKAEPIMSLPLPKFGINLNF